MVIGSSLYGLLVGLMGFLRMGTSGFSAQACGSGDGALLRQTLLQGLLLAMGWALLLILLSLPFSDLALRLMQPAAELDSLAREFFYLRLLGLPAALANYALIGWLLGTQNARAPLLIMLTTNLLNAALCVLFVIGLDWGISGAAYAAVLAEYSGTLLGLLLTRRAIRQWPGRIDWPALRHWLSWRPLLALNRDILIRTLALHLVFFLVTVQGTRLGTSTVAANALLINGLMLWRLCSGWPGQCRGSALRPRHWCPRRRGAEAQPGGGRRLVVAAQPAVGRGPVTGWPAVYRAAK